MKNNYLIDGRGNLIHRTAIVENPGNLGKNNTVGPYCIVTKHAHIGDGNIFQAYCSIGTIPEDRRAWEADYIRNVVIGNNNRFNEFVTVNAGFEGDTVIKDDCYFLTKSHVGHDAKIGRKCKIHSFACVGGHVVLLDEVYLGLGAIVNPRVIMGAGSLAGSGAVVTGDVKSYTKVVGVPHREIGPNEPRR